MLSDVTFKVAEGHALALLGRNGTGQTTLVTSIIGVTHHVSGTFSLDGRDITGMRRTNARMPASAGCRKSAIFFAL